MSYISCMDSPVGIIRLASTEKGICAVSLDSTEQSFIYQVVKLTGDSQTVSADNEHLTRAKNELQAYFKGQLKNFNVTLDIIGTDFQKRVWTLLLSIPYGKLNTYADIAEKLGGKQFSRAVGTANKHNPIPIIIPCHRVIREGRCISNYSGGLHVQRKLFEIESIPHMDIKYLKKS